MKVKNSFDFLLHYYKILPLILKKYMSLNIIKTWTIVLWVALSAQVVDASEKIQNTCKNIILPNGENIDFDWKNIAYTYYWNDVLTLQIIWDKLISYIPNSWIEITVSDIDEKCELENTEILY